MSTAGVNVNAPRKDSDYFNVTVAVAVVESAPDTPVNVIV
jgi:hypothetical protein